ncbi:MAG TPA: glycosyltransferase family 39 protein [Solirubrobacteraceae bacterium]|nr:glycosyltransferase family 39 protein [Solirubrobacteraceae bacterium]
MTTVAASRRRYLPDFDMPTPAWVDRQPAWLIGGGVVVLAMLLSTFLRTRYINGQFWMDEALSVGISSHSLTSIPGVLRHDGSPPLYYLLLHVWMSIAGNSETDTHWLSLVFGLATVPVGTWIAWSLFGRRAGLIAAVLFAMNPFLTAYSQETRMYTLMALLGLLATGAFIHGFIYRRRRWLILFAICQALMLYTHAWGIFFGVGAALALIPVWSVSDDRRGLIKDAVLSFGAAAVLFLPWLPTLLYQASHTGSPWDTAPNFGAPVQISRNLMGGDRATTALVLAAAIGLASLWAKSRRTSREAMAMWVLIIIPIGTLAFGWVLSRFSPAWQYRYFAPILGALLLLAAWGMARAKGVGLIALALVVLFWANPKSYTPTHKSDMKDVGGEMAPLLHPGDVVISGQPEQVPLMWYYLPAGLRFTDTTGLISHDPQSMNWVHALKRLENASPTAKLMPLVASLKPGQQILFVRPMTEGAQSWEAPWTQLVRRRSAQWGAILASLAANGTLKAVRWAPHYYRGACCVADSAILYQKVSS